MIRAVGFDLGGTPMDYQGIAPSSWELAYDEALAAAQLSMLDAALLTSVEVGTHKPDPDGFACLAMVLGCAPEEVLFVGDEEKDIDGARAAGMTAALVWRGDGPSPQYGQHFTVASLSELPALVTSGPS